MSGRTLAVHLPGFRLERCGFGGDELAALIGEWKSAVRIVAATSAARDEGVVAGITATEARALLPEIALLQWDESGEREDRAALCQRFEALSDLVDPLCEPPWEDALLLDATYTARGDEAGMAERAVALARSLGHSARAAVADDPLAARALAEWVAEEGGVIVAPSGRAGEWLAPLPVTAVVSDPDLVAALTAIGIERLGQWAKLDPAAVANRYGRRAARLQAVALGRTGPRRPPVVPQSRELPSAQAPLAGATTSQEIAFVLPSVLERIEAQLRSADRAAVRLRVVLKLEGTQEAAPSLAFSVRVGRPTRSARLLQPLVLARLERFRLAGGLAEASPIEELRVEVIDAAADGGWQPGLAERTEGGEPFADLVARLSDQLGEDALFVPELSDRWRPEEAWRPRSCTALGSSARASSRPPARRGKDLDPVDEIEHHERAARFPLPRPSLLLPQPVPVEVEIAGSDGAPERIRTAHSWYRIDVCAGPERISGEWWSPSPFDREYWAVRATSVAAQADARWLWVFRERASSAERKEPRWFVHGYFD